MFGVLLLVWHNYFHHVRDFLQCRRATWCLIIVSDIAVFVLKRDVKLQLTSDWGQQSKQYDLTVMSNSQRTWTNVVVARSCAVGVSWRMRLNIASPCGIIKPFWKAYCNLLDILIFAPSLKKKNGEVLSKIRQMLQSSNNAANFHHSFTNRRFRISQNVVLESVGDRLYKCKNLGFFPWKKATRVLPKLRPAY